MLNVFAMSLALLQSAGGAVWQAPDPAAEPVAASRANAPDLPGWALADPFGWERSQCSPLIRGDQPLETCQARVRGELSAALGDRLPAGLRPPGEPVPCLATPGDDGAYPVQCGVPERRLAQAPVPRIPDCRSRPTRAGGAVAFTTECDDTEEDGLSFTLFGDDD